MPSKKTEPIKDESVKVVESNQDRIKTLETELVWLKKEHNTLKADFDRLCQSKGFVF
jgi:hypothetical protein